MPVPSLPRDPADPTAHAPARRLRPDAWPTPAEVRAYLLDRGIDPDDLFALMAEVCARGWVFRLGGGVQGGRVRCSAAVVVPGLDLWAWATCHGGGPAEALAGVLALALASPPPLPAGGTGPTG